MTICSHNRTRPTCEPDADASLVAEAIVRNLEAVMIAFVAKRSSGAGARRDRGVANSIVRSADVRATKAVITGGAPGACTCPMAVAEIS